MTVAFLGEERRRKAAWSGACICRNSHVHCACGQETDFLSCLQELLVRQQEYCHTSNGLEKLKIGHVESYR